MKKTAIVLFMSLAAMSCQKEKKSLTDYFSQEQEYSVKTLETYPMDSIGDPHGLLSTGNCIILSEPYLDKIISLYDIATRKFTRFLTKGQGPDELVHVYQIDAYSDSAFYARDGQKLFVYSFDGDFAHPSQKLKLPENTGMSSYYNRDVCIHSQRTGKPFVLHDMKNQSQHEFGETITLENCPPEYLSGMLQTLITGNASAKKIAWASKLYDILEIYDFSDTGNIKTVKRYVGDLPPAQLREGRPFLAINNKLCTNSITSDNKYIYALYIGQTGEEREKSKGSPCNKILVYDWDGNPVKMLKVDKEIRHISANEKQQTLYCLGRGDAEYEVYAIPVKDLE
jgi:hypothetical protein